MNPDSTAEPGKQEDTALPGSETQAGQAGAAQASDSSPSFGCRRLEVSTTRTVAPTSAECNPSETLPPRNAANQRELVLQLLRKRGTQGLSSLEALRYGIMRLPNRCGELRKMNYAIEGRTEAGGVMRYFLRGEPEKVKPLPSYEQRSREIEREAMPLFAGMRP